MNHLHRTLASLTLGLVTSLNLLGCGPGHSGQDVTAEETEALTTGTAPINATITDGVGAAFVQLGQTPTEVTTRLGSPASCTPDIPSQPQTCSYRSADGVLRAQASFDNGSPRRLAIVRTPFSNAGWKTLKGIVVGSTASALNSAYGSAIDTAKSTSYSKVVPGVDAAGRPSITQFTLGWFNEYQPNQYFGVTDISVVRVSPQPPTGGSTAPNNGSISEGIGAANAILGLTQVQLAAVWGNPFSCTLVTALSNQSCTFKSPDGVVRASVTFNSALPRQAVAISIPSSNQAWATTKNIKVGSTETAVLNAYFGSIDLARSSSLVKVISGTDSRGLASDTRITLGWFNEYTASQYLGVTSISVATR